MAERNINGIAQEILRLNRQDEIGLTDGQLLDSFVLRGDQTALAAIIKRHAPMVWGVCRRLLHRHHDAEDAFQATFLVLVRKAVTIRDKESLANWLYGVGRQTAIRLRAIVARQHRREEQMMNEAEPAVSESVNDNELRTILYQELSALPKKYRILIILCDLEGRSRKAVARQLGCPEGTVKGRLARARAMLAKRISRRGLALQGALAAMLSQTASTASVPPTVVSSAIEVVTHYAQGRTISGTISTQVTDLTRGVLKTMLLNKLKIVMLSLLILIGTLGVSGWLFRIDAAEQPTPQAGKTDLTKNTISEAKSKPASIDGKENTSGLAPGQYTGACEVMEFSPTGSVSYPDRPGPCICHLEVNEDGSLKAEFPDKNLGRGRWNTITLKLSVKESQAAFRAVWTASHQGDVYKATAIPYSPGLYLFRLEILTDGKLVGGAQQYFGIRGKEVLKTDSRVKSDEKAAEPVDKVNGEEIAWGKEVDGLQAGIVFGRGGNRPYRIGETVGLVIKLRNVGKAVRTYSFLGYPLFERSPTVVDAKGNRMGVAMPPRAYYYVVTSERALKPGEEVVFGPVPTWVNSIHQAAVALESPDRTEREVSVPTLRVPPGKYTILYEGFLSSHPNLSTPSLPLEIVDKKKDSDSRLKPDEKLVPQKIPPVSTRPNRPYTIDEIDSKLLLDLGNQFDVEVVGSTEGIVSGTDVYFIDSNLATAAVHAGVVKSGEKAVITVTVVKCPDKGVGSTQNGVKSLPWSGATVRSALLLQRKQIDQSAPR
jgi:RNA polymerase sigma factor (sigma-70 family)